MLHGKYTKSDPKLLTPKVLQLYKIQQIGERKNGGSSCKWMEPYPCLKEGKITKTSLRLGKITPGTPSFCFKHKPLSLLTPFNLYASCQTLYSQSILLPSPPSLVSLTNYKRTSNIFSVSDHTYNVYALHKTFPIQHDMHYIKEMKAKIKTKAQACPWIAKDILPKIQPKPKSLNS